MWRLVVLVRKAFDKQTCMGELYAERVLRFPVVSVDEPRGPEECSESGRLTDTRNS
jgi:hypothetical protein